MLIDKETRVYTIKLIRIIKIPWIFSMCSLIGILDLSSITLLDSQLDDSIISLVGLFGSISNDDTGLSTIFILVSIEFGFNTFSDLISVPEHISLSILFCFIGSVPPSIDESPIASELSFSKKINK